MREFKKRRGQKEELLRLVIKVMGTILLLVVTVMLMRAAWGMYAKMASSSQARNEAQLQLARMEAQRTGVNSTLGEITSDRGVEKQIRERYGVVRPGEGQIDVIRDTKTATTTEVVKEGWWTRLFHALFVW